MLVLVGVFAWVILRPSSESKARTQMTGTTAGYTYAEINAEPWATVTAVSPVSAAAQSIVGQQTPLRVKLPPGRYSVTLLGPNREAKQVDVRDWRFPFTASAIVDRQNRVLRSWFHL